MNVHLFFVERIYDFISLQITGQDFGFNICFVNIPAVVLLFAGMAYQTILKYSSFSHWKFKNFHPSTP